MICILIIIPKSIINVTSEPVIGIVALLNRSHTLYPPVTINQTRPLDTWYVVIEWSTLLVTDSGRLI